MAALRKYIILSVFLLLQISLLSSPVYAKRLGLILATNYTGNKADIPPLKLCEEDAKLIKKRLETSGKFDRVEVLLGSMVTKKNVQKKLAALAKTVTAKDTVLIYFSGHGTYQKDISAPNGMRNFLLMYQPPHLPDNILDKWVRKIKTKQLVWILDSCYSGGIAAKGKEIRGSGSLPIASDQIGKVIENGDANLYFGNKAIVGSSSSNQMAIEIGKPINHGLFTYWFSKSFTSPESDLDGDGIVTLLEAYEWSKPRVSKMARRYRHRQVPMLSGNASGIHLAGNLQAKPSLPKPDPETTKTEVPAVTQKPKPTLKPPIVAASTKSQIIIFTTIFKSIMAGPTPSDSKKLVQRNKQPNKTRKIKVSVSGKNYPTKIHWLNHKQLKAKSGEQIPLGVYSHRGKVYKNRIAQIVINRVPTGVHKITLEADGYPKLTRQLGVEKLAANNKLFVVTSLKGYGSIRGKVFFKSFSQPLAGHKVYMPVIKQVNQTHSMVSAKDGSFWFLNLVPSKDYFIKASFAENLPLDNKKLTVKANEITSVDIVLNRKFK